MFKNKRTHNFTSKSAQKKSARQLSYGKVLLPAIFICLMFFNACSLKKTATAVMGDVAWDGQALLEQEADVEIARQSTLPMVTTLAVLGQGDPSNRKIAALLAKAYGQYAYGFYEEDMLRFQGKQKKKYQLSLLRADRFYRQGMTHGLAALQKNRTFRNAFTSNVRDFSKAVGKMGKKDAHTLFWTAFCWAGSLNLNRDNPAAIINLPRVNIMIDRVLELAPNYNHGAVYSFKAVLDASRPPMLGGNPKNAKTNFEKSLAVEPRYLMNQVLYAQYYAVQVQNKSLFKRLLTAVKNAPAGEFKQQELANQLAKRRANLLLKKINKLF